MTRNAAFYEGFKAAYEMMGGNAESDELQRFCEADADDRENKEKFENYTDLMDALQMFEHGVKFAER